MKPNQISNDGAVSKIHIEVGKIAAIEEIPERGDITGCRIWTTGGQSFGVKEKPEDVFAEASRIIDRELLKSITE